MNKVFLGWDAREGEAFDVAAGSIERRSSRPVDVHPLRYDLLARAGYLWRNRYEMDTVHDEVSCSTAFGKTRFLVPHLQERGWALYADCDIVMLDDVQRLFQIGRLEPRYAVLVVKHQHTPTQTLKMDAQPQRAYPRKNWSSVMLWNCEHPAHRRLSLQLINEWPRQFLHRFCWLDDAEIGELPAEWNWLVGVQPRPETPRLAHFTLGGPWLPGWQGGAHDALWQAERDALRVAA